MFKGFNNRQQHGFPDLNFYNDKNAFGQGGVLVWLDPAFGTNTQTNGANISEWIDRANGVRYTQSTVANQPSYILSDANFNNLPAINFGTNVARILNGSTSFGLGSNTLAIVVRNTSITATVGNLILGISPGFDSGQSGFYGSGLGSNVTGFGYYTANTAFAKTNIEDTTSHIIVSNRNLFIIDGINQNITPVNTGLTFGSIGGANLNNLPNCVIAEIILYSSTLNTDQCIAISNQLNLKYNKY